MTVPLRLPQFKATNVYWSGPLGVYGSLRAGLVATPSTDSAYQAWLAAQPPPNQPLPWPIDGTGAQTAAALDAVLAFYGLPITGLAPLTKAELTAYAFGKVTALMAIARTYALGGSPPASVKCDGATATGADLAALNAWGAANPTRSTTWVDDFGVATAISGTQACSLAAAVVAYGQSVYDILGTAATEVASGSITTTGAIDALAWPT
jgi:hypothetical protein